MKKVGLSAECTNGNIASLASQIDHFKSLGIDSVEIPLFETDIICGKKIVSSELGILINILDNKDIAKTVHGEMSVNLLDSEYFDDHKEILKKDIEVSGAIGATHLVTHFGYTTNTIFDDQTAYSDLLTRQNDCYAEMGEYAKKHGTVLAIENLFPFTVDNYAPMPSEIGAQVKKIKHPNIKCCLDISHAYINCTYRNAHFIDEIKNMGPLAEHIHMHDSFGILQQMRTNLKSEASSYGFGDLHLPLGWGDIPFAKVFESLEFPENINLNFELPSRYEKYWQQNIIEARQILEKI